MPQIRINEVDSSTTSGLATTTNAVFVPGYAIMGPVNTPTLCNSVDEFERIFGSTPYYFEEDQVTWWGDSTAIKPVDATIRKGTAEKSYIYAHELLEQGLPVIYERVMRVDKEALYRATAKFITNTGSGEQDSIILKSKDVGATAFLIGGTLEKKEYAVDASTKLPYYELSLGRAANSDLFVSKIEPAITRFTFNYPLSLLGNIPYYEDVLEDTLGLVEFDWSGIINADPDFSKFLQFVGTVTVTATDICVNTRLEQEEDEPDDFVLVYDASTKKFVAGAFDVDGNTVYPFAVADMYSALAGGTNSASILDALSDKGEYVFKFLTTGAYPVLDQDKDNTIANKMVEIAGHRGDITALVDAFNEGKKIGAVHEAVIKWVKSGAVVPVQNEYGQEPLYKYATVIYPHGVYRNSVIKRNVVMPGSFGYVLALAASVQSNPNYYAVAGVKRGNPSKLVSLAVPVSNAEAEAVQPEEGISINPITNIKPYGLILWGNRTLYDSTLDGGLKASSFLNVRQLANDIKRSLFVASRELTFEQNNDILWINFKSKINPLLDQMVANGGIAGYEWKRIPTVKKATLKAKLMVYAIEAVENFDLTLDISDNVLTVAE